MSCAICNDTGRVKLAVPHRRGPNVVPCEDCDAHERLQRLEDCDHDWQYSEQCRLRRCPKCQWSEVVLDASQLSEKEQS